MPFYRSRQISRPHRCTLFRHSRQAEHSCHHQHSQLYMALRRLLPPPFAASFQTVDGTLYTRYILHPASIHPHSLKHKQQCCIPIPSHLHSPPFLSCSYSAFLTSTYLLPQKPFCCLRHFSRHHRYTLFRHFSQAAHSCFHQKSRLSMVQDPPSLTSPPQLAAREHPHYMSNSPSLLIPFSGLQLFRLPVFNTPRYSEAFLPFTPIQPLPQTYLIPTFQPGCEQLPSPAIPTLHGATPTTSSNIRSLRQHS
jgi:hypothetical protein